MSFSTTIPPFIGFQKKLNSVLHQFAVDINYFNSMVASKNFTVYKSSAGSGKTYTLVLEYLKLVLSSKQPDRYKSILAITFTNKAANEMKSRVMEALTKFSSGDSFDMLNSLCQELNEPEEVLRIRAKKVLEHILHHYADFGVSTIDKFVHKIVRTFAYDLRIPMNFEVEMDGNQLISSAVDQLLEQVGTNANLTKALIEFTEGKTDDEKSWNIENDINNYAQNLLKEEGQLHAERLKKIKLQDFFTHRNKLHARVKATKDRICTPAIRGLELIMEHNIDFKSFARGGLPTYFKRVRDLDIKNIDPVSTLQKSIAEDKWVSSKCPPHDKEAIESIKSELTQLYFESLKNVKEDLPDLIIYRMIEKNIYALAVLNEIEAKIETIKKDQNIIHISEFNKKIANIVLNEPAPFVYERLGERYKNYLIDEFQDTSELQFHNLLPLIDNSLSTGNKNLLVGDGKQAIYRWRGGEVEQFSNLPTISTKFGNQPVIKERTESLYRNYNEMVLDTNYRSKRNVIEFNNWFFENISQKLAQEYRGIYTQQKQKYLTSKVGGFVSLHALQRDDKETYYANTFRKTLEIITSAISDGYRLMDITILCRKRKDASEIATFLVENDIPVVSSDSLLVSGNAEVKLLISFLRHLLNPSDDMAKIYIAHTLGGESMDHTFLQNIFKNGADFFTFLTDKIKGYDSTSLLQKSLFETVEELIRVLNINQNNNPYVLAFIQFVQDTSNRSGSSIDEFLMHWENKKDSLSIQVPDGENAISIMTIHKSKGLQFPIVIFPFANWQTRNADNLWIDTHDLNMDIPSALVDTSKHMERTTYKQTYEAEVGKTLLDNINLLYVAFTRPEDRLYVITSEYQWHDLSKSFLDFTKDSNNWNENEREYTLGKEEVYSTKHNHNLNQVLLKKSVFNHWKPRVEISLQADTTWLINSESSRKDYGKLLHFVLAQITSKDNVTRVLEKLRVEGQFTAEEFKNISNDIESIVNHTSVQEYFTRDYRVMNESEIMLENGDVIRPDRVAIKGQTAVIIDYKTGLMKKSHEKQIIKYGDALKELGYQNIIRLLIYTNPIKVIEV